MPERKGHGKEVDHTEYYATTPALALHIAKRIQKDFGVDAKLVLEPGCGSGSFLKAIRTTWPGAAVHGIELAEDLGNWSKGQGFDVTISDLLKRHWGKVDLIIGNPPFSLSEAFIHHLRDHLTEDGLLVLLLRLNFAGGQERYQTLWSRYKPARIYALPARPGFTADGATDATDYCVMVWRKEPTLTCEFDWLDTTGVQVKWNGTPARKKNGVIVKEAVLDPEYPDPRKNKKIRLVKDEPVLKKVK